VSVDFILMGFWQRRKDQVAGHRIKSAPSINTKKRSGGYASKVFRLRRAVVPGYP